MILVLFDSKDKTGATDEADSYQGEKEPVKYHANGVVECLVPGDWCSKKEVVSCGTKSTRYGGSFAVQPKRPATNTSSTLLG